MTTSNKTDFITEIRKKGKYSEAYDTYMKGAMSEVSKEKFDNTETYMLYFMLETIKDGNDRAEIVFLNKSYGVIKVLVVGKKTFLDLEKTVLLIEMNALKCDAAHVIIFRNAAEGDFTTEFFRANSIFSSLKTVSLYDFVLKTDSTFRSIISDFR